MADPLLVLLFGGKKEGAKLFYRHRWVK